MLARGVDLISFHMCLQLCLKDALQHFTRRRVYADGSPVLWVCEVSRLRQGSYEAYFPRLRIDASPYRLIDDMSQGRGQSMAELFENLCGNFISPLGPGILQPPDDL